MRTRRVVSRRAVGRRAVGIGIALAGIALPLLLAGGSAGASTLRCGTELVSVGDVAAEVLLKCGEPLTRETVAVESEGDTDTVVERWTYHMGDGQFLKILTFEAGVLTSVENGERQ